MESKINISEKIEPNSSAEILTLDQRNDFILSIINELGFYFDKKFVKHNCLFDEYIQLKCLFDYFSSYCGKKKKIRKKLAINLIFCILVKINTLTKHYVNFINVLVNAITSENPFKKEDDFLNKLLNSDLKLCLNQEQYEFIIQYRKSHSIDISLLFDFLIHLFEENNEKDLLSLICNDLKAKYPKLIKIDLNIDSIDIKKEEYLSYLNKLINLDFESMVDMMVLDFEDSEFKLRKASNDEADTYIREEPQAQKKRKSKRLSHETNSGKITPYSSNEKDNMYETNCSETSNDSSNCGFDSNNFSPLQKFLYDEIKKTNQKFNEANERWKTTEIKLEMVQKELELEKDKNERSNNESINIKYGLQQQIAVLNNKVKGLQLDMKTIKVRSVYKGIIDIFTKVFGLNLYDSYKVKIQKIFNSLESFPQNDKVSELEEFLSNILFYIYEGNDLAHLVKDGTLPLDLAFSVLEERGKLSYKYLKNIFINLSLNSPLKYADKYYFYQDDDDNFMKNIKFTIENLEDELR